MFCFNPNVYNALALKQKFIIFRINETLFKQQDFCRKGNTFDERNIDSLHKSHSSKTGTAFFSYNNKYLLKNVELDGLMLVVLSDPI